MKRRNDTLRLPKHDAEQIESCLKQHKIKLGFKKQNHYQLAAPTPLQTRLSENSGGVKAQQF